MRRKKGRNKRGKCTFIMSIALLEYSKEVGIET